MLTPFETDFARQVIVSFLDDAKAGGLDAAAYIDERLFCGAKMYAEDRTPLAAAEASLTAWVGACIVDDIVNGTEYAAYCDGYKDKYCEVLNAMQDDLKKTQRKLFRKVPVHNLDQLVFDAHSVLIYVQDKLGVYGNEPPKLSKDEKKRFLIDRHDELEEELLDLSIRLDEQYTKMTGIK